MAVPSGAFPLTWVLSDGRPGHDHQAQGVAEALGWPFAIKRISYGPLARLPNPLLGRSMRGLSREARGALAPPWPDLVIGAGRRTVPPARWLKRRHAGMLLVQLMWPGSARDLDLIAVPEHDRVADRPGVLRTLGAPGRVTPQRLAAAAAALAPRLAGLPQPRIACLVGGARRRHAVHAGGCGRPRAARQPVGAKLRRQPAGGHQPAHHAGLRGGAGSGARCAASHVSIRGDVWRTSISAFSAAPMPCGDRGLGVDVQRGVRHRPAGLPRRRAEDWHGQARDVT